MCNSTLFCLLAVQMLIAVQNGQMQVQPRSGSLGRSREPNGILGDRQIDGKIRWSGIGFVRFVSVLTRYGSVGFALKLGYSPI